MKRVLAILFVLVSLISYTRNYSELEEWRQKNLPLKVRNGLLVEIDDIKKVSSDITGVRLRAQNFKNGAIRELNIKIWFWTDDGVVVEELQLLDGGFDYLNSGEDEYYPSRNRYYKIKGLKFEEIKKMNLELGKVSSRRVR